MAQPSWPQPLMKKGVDGKTCMNTLWIQQDTSSKVLVLFVLLSHRSGRDDLAQLFTILYSTLSG